MNLPDTPLTRRTLEIATAAHAGQFRRDGKPYISHPVAVAALVLKPFAIDHDKERMSQLLYVIALAHDIGEDCPGYDERRITLELGDLITPGESNDIRESLGLLNKHNHKSYRDYIIACKDDFYAQYTKAADLTHNLSDLPPGTQRDKYELALYILES